MDFFLYLLKAVGDEGTECHALPLDSMAGKESVGVEERRVAWKKTGPVRELEKLRQNPLFHDFKLGRIEVWNW